MGRGGTGIEFYTALPRKEPPILPRSPNPQGHPSATFSAPAHLVVSTSMLAATALSAAVTAQTMTACITPKGLGGLADGCGRRPPRPTATVQRRVTMHIATCQEDLSWLPACDLLEGLTIRVVHKCSAAHPGLKRGPDGLLGRREWNPPLRESGDESGTRVGRTLASRTFSRSTQRREGRARCTCRSWPRSLPRPRATTICTSSCKATGRATCRSLTRCASSQVCPFPPSSLDRVLRRCGRPPSRTHPASLRPQADPTSTLRRSTQRTASARIASATPPAGRRAGV